LKTRLITCIFSDPDIKPGDGIYSRYFLPPVTGQMYYSLTVVVDDNDGKAYTTDIIDRKKSPGTWCFSFLLL